MTTLNVSLAGSSPPSAQASRYAALLSADAMDGLRGQEAVLRSLAACAKRIGGGGHGVIGCSPPGAFTMRNRLLRPARHWAGNTNPKMRRGAVLLVTRPCLAACHARYSAVYVCRQSQRPAWACACYQSFIERMEDRIAAHADACGPVEGSARGRPPHMAHRHGASRSCVPSAPPRHGTQADRGHMLRHGHTSSGLHPKRIGARPKRVNSRDAEGTLLAGLGR